MNVHIIRIILISPLGSRFYMERGPRHFIRVSSSHPK